MFANFRLSAQPVADIPCLTLTPDAAEGEMPLALVLHGLGHSKEDMLPTLYALGQRGICAVAPDVRRHGNRPHASERDHQLEQDYFGTMTDMIEGTAQDISLLLETLAAPRAAVHGVSLGGYIAFAAFANEPRLAVCSVALGSPDWLEPLRALGLGPGDPIYDAVATRSPLERAAATYPPRPLLMQHGDADERVPIQGVQTLVRRLAIDYQDMPERLDLAVYPGLGHVYTEEMQARAVDWITRFIAVF